MSKCTISFNDNENGIFYAGQTLTGKVELYLPEAKNCSGLRLTIEGAAKCKWAEQMGMNKKSYSVTYKGQELYLNDISYLFGCKDGESMIVEAGFHTYNFSCFLPPVLPYSVEAAHGSVRYKIEAYLDVTYEIDGKMDREFTICRHDDLNLYPDLKMPCQKEASALFCCRFFSCQPLMMEVSIPYSGYVPGDTINVTIKIINKSNATVPKCRIELIRIIKYTSEENRTKMKSKVMVKVETQGVERRTTASFDKELVIPSNLTSTNEMFCKVFQITFEIKVTCKTKGCSVVPEVSFPITLGSVPLSVDQTFQPVSLPENESINTTSPFLDQLMNQSHLN